MARAGPLRRRVRTSAAWTRTLMWRPDTAAVCMSPARLRAEYSVWSRPDLSPRVTAAAMGAAVPSKAAPMPARRARAHRAGQ